MGWLNPKMSPKVVFFTYCKKLKRPYPQPFKETDVFFDFDVLFFKTGALF